MGSAGRFSRRSPGRLVRRALGLLVVLVVAGLALGFYEIHRRVTTPLAETSDRPLLSWREAPPRTPDGLPSWEAAALRDRHAAFDPATFADPPREDRPWIRWWWPGNVVDRRELVRELHAFDEHGFGGVEIQSLAVGVSEQDRASPGWREQGWDRPAFYENLAAVLAEAKAIGMEVDLTAGSGWPSGGPHVGLEDGLRSLVHGEALLSGPARISMSVPEPRLPVVHWALGWVRLFAPFGSVFVEEARRPVTVLGARVTGGERTWSPFDLTDQLTLDPTSLRSLDGAVDAEGVLRWDVPPGDWVVVALYEMPGGELGSAARDEPTYVVDHLDAERVRAHDDYLLGSRTGLPPYYGDPLRAFFNDSFEFKQERLWPRGMIDEFRTRRGYDPRPWMPALLRAGYDQAPLRWAGVRARPEYDLGEDGRRFEEDWEQTLSDVFLERFLRTSADWARARGLASRTQAYGFDFDLVRAAGLTDIPETEQMGGATMFLKIPSSGALLYDRPLVSAEAFVHKRRAYMSTAAKVAVEAARLFAAGVNQIIYHGAAYQVPDPEARGYGPGGWYPFADAAFSDDFSERHPHWASLADVNRSIARVQYALRLGRPEADVLVYYPFLGFPGEEVDEGDFLQAGAFVGEPPVSNESTLPVPLSGAEPDARVEWLRRIRPLLRALESSGASWIWVDPISLREARAIEGRIEIREHRFESLLLYDVEALAPEVAESLADLSEEGAQVVVVGEAPRRQRGLAPRKDEDGDERVRRAMRRVTTRTPAVPAASTAEAAAAILAGLESRPVRYDDEGVQSWRRRLDSGDRIVFLHNTRPTTVFPEVVLGGEPEAVTGLAPESGATWPLDFRDGRGRVRLPPYGSRLLLTSHGDGDERPDTRTPLQRVQDEGRLRDRREVATWHLVVEGEDVPGGSFETTSALFDWKDSPELRSSASRGTYAARFEAGAKEPRVRRVLSLGTVLGIAEVRVNGRPAGTVSVWPFEIDVTSLVHPGTNEVEITLVPPRRNREVARREERTGIAALLVEPGERMSTGLLGPVAVEEWEE